MKKTLKILMTICISIISMIILTAIAVAAPMDGTEFQFKQPDGELVNVKVYGDEFYQRVESLDGYTLIRDPETKYICYAKLNEDGSDFVATDIVYHNYSTITRAALDLPKGLTLDSEHILEKVNETKALFQTDDIQLMSANIMETTPYAVGIDKAQKINGITIKIDFPDEISPMTTAELDNFLNAPGYSGYNNNGSVRDYFYDVSNGIVEYHNEVFYYMAAHNKEYYDREDGYPNTSKELVIEALTALESNPVFMEYIPTLTRKANGTVAALNVLYAGSPSWGWTKGLWPHSWGIYLKTINGVNFTGYQITNIGNDLSIRTFAHENGHMLFGFPDLYDYTYTTSGLGNFCLMAYGGSDKNPVPPNPYLREKAGWTSSKDLNSCKWGEIVKPVVNDFSAYKYSTALDNEYFMIENIEKKDRYKYFPGNGIVIYHVDEKGNNSDASYMTADKHAMVSVEPADVSETKNYYPHGSQSNMYPYKNNNKFTSDSIPNSKLWSGANSGLNIVDITSTGEFVYNYEYNINIYPVAYDETGDLQTISLSSQYRLPSSVYIVVNKYNVLGTNIYSESQTIDTNGTTALYSITPLTVGLANHVEVLVYEDDTCDFLLGKGLLYPIGFDF